MERKLSEISGIYSGHQTRKAVENDAAGSHCLLQIRDLNEARTAIRPDGLIRFSPASPDKERPLKSGDVLFLARGQKNFACTVPELPYPTLASSYFFILRPQEAVTGPYLAWFLNQPAAQLHFKRLATTGAHMPVVTRDVIESLHVSVPDDLETQSKIVELNALAVTQAKLLAELAEKKKALATAACNALANAELKAKRENS